MTITNYPPEIQEQLIEVDKIKDGLGKPVDDNIKPLVAVLQAYGIETTNSCGGHKERRNGGPFVSIESGQAAELESKLLSTSQDPKDSEYSELLNELETQNLAERGSLLDFLDDFYKDRNTDNWVRLIVQDMGNRTSKLVCQGASVIDRFEYEKERNEWLIRAQKEFDDFTEFMINSFSDEEIVYVD